VLGALGLGAGRLDVTLGGCAGRLPWRCIRNEMMVKAKTKASFFTWSILLVPENRAPFDPKYV